MTNVTLVARKLAVLTEHLSRIRARRPLTVEGYSADTVVQDAIALSLLVVVQEATDIALHIASDEGWEVATTFRDAFQVLATHGVLTKDLADRLGQTAQLRNRIAHGYATIDAPRMWTELPAGIAIFDEFAAIIARLVAPPVAP